MDQIVHQIFNAVHYHAVVMLIALRTGKLKVIQFVDQFLLFLDSMPQTNLGFQAQFYTAANGKVLFI